MKKTEILYVLLAILLICLSFFSLKAQSVPYTPDIFSNPVLQQDLANRNIINTGISGLIRAQMGRGGARGSGRTAVAPRDVTSFQASSANSLAGSFAAQYTDPAEKRRASEMFDRALQEYWDTAKQESFSANSLASAFLYYFESNYEIYYDVGRDFAQYQNDVTKAPHYIYASRRDVIFRQFQAMLAQSGEIKKLSDKDRQQAAELVVIPTGGLSLMYQEAIKSGDRGAVKKAQQVAKDNLMKLFAVAPENITVDDQGISTGK